MSGGEEAPVALHEDYRRKRMHSTRQGVATFVTPSCSLRGAQGKHMRILRQAPEELRHPRALNAAHTSLHGSARAENRMAAKV